MKRNIIIIIICIIFLAQSAIAKSEEGINFIKEKQTNYIVWNQYKKQTASMFVSKYKITNNTKYTFKIIDSTEIDNKKYKEFLNDMSLTLSPENEKVNIKNLHSKMYEYSKTPYIKRINKQYKENAEDYTKSILKTVIKKNSNYEFNRIQNDKEPPIVYKIMLYNMDTKETITLTEDNANCEYDKKVEIIDATGTKVTILKN